LIIFSINSAVSCEPFEDDDEDEEVSDSDEVTLDSLAWEDVDADD